MDFNKKRAVYLDWWETKKAKGKGEQRQDKTVT